MLVCPADGLEHGVPVRDVERERQDCVPVGCDQRVKRFGIAGRGRDLVAALERGFGPDPAKAA
jgi:hypothetical protein